MTRSKTARLVNRSLFSSRHSLINRRISVPKELGEGIVKLTSPRRTHEHGCMKKYHFFFKRSPENVLWRRWEYRNTHMRWIRSRSCGESYSHVDSRDCVCEAAGRAFRWCSSWIIQLLSGEETWLLWEFMVLSITDQQGNTENSFLTYTFVS